MYQLVFLRSAEFDIDTIAEYSKAAWGDTRAQKTIEQIQQTLSMVCEHPEVGSVSSVASVWQTPVPRLPFLILYQVTDTAVVVISVLHTSRNF